jgi:hypothetical protein
VAAEVEGEGGDEEFQPEGRCTRWPTAPKSSRAGIGVSQLGPPSGRTGLKYLLPIQATRQGPNGTLLATFGAPVAASVTELRMLLAFGHLAWLASIARRRS